MNIKRGHDMSVAEARTRVERIAAELQDRFGLESSWEENVLLVWGQNVDGLIILRDREVEISVDLGPPLIIMAGPIRTAIEATMEKNLG